MRFTLLFLSYRFIAIPLGSSLKRTAENIMLFLEFFFLASRLCLKLFSCLSLNSCFSLILMHGQVIGLNNVPLAGDEFEVVGSLDVAREKAEAQAELMRNERISAKAGDGKITLSSFASAVSAGKHTGLDLHQLNIILKVDVQVC